MDLFGLFWNNPTRDWQQHERTEPVLDLRTPSINGVRFGTACEGLISLGKPDPKLLRTHGSYKYRISGFIVQTHEGLVDQVWIDFVEPNSASTSAAKALTIINPEGPIKLTVATTQVEIEQAFGKPNEMDEDDFGADLDYIKPGYELEFQLSPDRTLQCLGFMRKR